MLFRDIKKEFETRENTSTPLDVTKSQILELKRNEAYNLR